MLDLQGFRREHDGLNKAPGTPGKETAMPPTTHTKLVEQLRQDLCMNKARAECFAAAVLSAIEAKSVLLTQIASHLPGEAKFKSKIRRLQNFFLQLTINYTSVAIFILGILRNVIGSEPLSTT